MNNDTVGGKFDQAVGKTKQGIGEAVGNQKLANEGLAQQAKGAVKETWGNAKDAAGEAHETAKVHADEHRSTVSQKIDNAKASVNEKIDDYKERKAEERKIG